MIISLIVAAAENNAIGKENRLLWRLPNDMKFFKNTTWALPVIMGRKTYESMGSKPLRGRKNIVITRQDQWQASGVLVAKDMDDAIGLTKEMDVNEIFIIGGGEIYKQAMPLAQRIYMTRVHSRPEGDTFFPAIDEKEWRLLSNTDHPADENHQYAYSFQVWERK